MNEHQTPELCFTVLESTGALVCVKRGEMGYYPSDLNDTNPAKNRKTADFMNERLGVTPLMERAMINGSMFGWTCPAADPVRLAQMESQKAPLSHTMTDAANRAAKRSASHGRTAPEQTL